MHVASRPAIDVRDDCNVRTRRTVANATLYVLNPKASQAGYSLLVSTRIEGKQAGRDLLHAQKSSRPFPGPGPLSGLANERRYGSVLPVWGSQSRTQASHFLRYETRIPHISQGKPIQLANPTAERARQRHGLAMTAGGHASTTRPGAPLHWICRRVPISTTSTPYAVRRVPPCQHGRQPTRPLTPPSSAPAAPSALQDLPRPAPGRDLGPRLRRIQAGAGAADARLPVSPARSLCVQLPGQDRRGGVVLPLSPLLLTCAKRRWPWGSGSCRMGLCKAGLFVSEGAQHRSGTPCA